MAQYKSIDLIDYLTTLLKWKKNLLILFISLFGVSYLVIYLMIEEEFESTALIVPAENNSLGGLSGIFKDLKNLPLGLGTASSSSGINLYNTIIYSRSSLETLIDKYKLMNDYGVDSKEKAIKILKEKIEAEETDDEAYEITISASSPKKAANMVNFLLEHLNKKVVDLNISKSKNNRMFIEQRYNEIMAKLRAAEDSLENYQKESGMFEAEEQVKLILGAYSELETDLTDKKLEFSFLSETLPEESPILKQMQIKWELYKKEIEALINNGKQNSVFLPYKSLPAKAKNYIRHYRDVEIYHSILEFVLPLLEQAKFEEEKNIPILQIIDYGSVPEKKSYPPRILFSFISASVVCSLIIFLSIMASIIRNSDNPKVMLLRKNLSFKS